jgi:hypothetical protein
MVMDAKRKYNKLKKRLGIVNESLLPQMIRLYGDNNLAYGKAYSILKRSTTKVFKEVKSATLDSEDEFNKHYCKNQVYVVLKHKNFSKIQSKYFKIKKRI